MKNRTKTEKSSLERMVYEAFMKSPIPLAITTAKNGVYVEVNEAGAKYMRLKREDVIGRKSTELGMMTKEQRQLFINEIREEGFARNIPIKIKINEQAVSVLLAAYHFKRGREDLLFCVMYSIGTYKPPTKNAQNDLFHKIALLDKKYIKSKLKQYPLTSRQQEIAMLSVAGRANRDIAKELCISEYTVKDHMKEIFHIIGIHNRSELIPKLLNLS